MDTPTPDHPLSPANPGLSRSVTTRLLKALAAATPAGATDSEADRNENLAAIRELFDSLDPRDPAEAQLAAMAIAAAQSAMDNFARAARPGVADDTAIRLRGSALSAASTYAAALHQRPPGGAGRRPRATTADPGTGPGRRQVPAARPVRPAYPALAHRGDDQGAGTGRPRVSARCRAGGRGDRRGGGHDRRAESSAMIADMIMLTARTDGSFAALA